MHLHPLRLALPLLFTAATITGCSSDGEPAASAQPSSSSPSAPEAAALTSASPTSASGSESSAMGDLPEGFDACEVLTEELANEIVPVVIPQPEVQAKSLQNCIYRAITTSEKVVFIVSPVEDGEQNFQDTLATLRSISPPPGIERTLEEFDGLGDGAVLGVASPEEDFVSYAVTWYHDDLAFGLIATAYPSDEVKDATVSVAKQLDAEMIERTG